MKEIKESEIRVRGGGAFSQSRLWLGRRPAWSESESEGWIERVIKEKET